MPRTPGDGKVHWAASPWRSLVYEEIVVSPITYGVVILGSAQHEPVLVTHGPIREEAWRLFRDPRSKAHGVLFYRYVETMIDREAERLARVIRQELERTSGRNLDWREFPEAAAPTVPVSDLPGDRPRQ